jgi:hypothetical protein
MNAWLESGAGFSIAMSEPPPVDFRRFNLAGAQKVMGEFIPEYLVREQAAVGALALFAILRVVCAAVAFEKGWRISVVQAYCIALAGLYCLPQLFDLFVHVYGMRASAAAAELEGKAAGSAIALFFAPILSHKLGYE